MPETYHAGAICSYLHSLGTQLDLAATSMIETALENVYLRRLLSSFELARQQTQGRSIHPLSSSTRHIAAVYSNLLQRGLPTFTSLRVERTLLSGVSSLTADLGLTFSEHVTTAKNIRFVHRSANRATEKLWTKALSEAHAVIDPRLKPKQRRTDCFGSPEESQFYQRILPSAIGDATTLWMSPQRPISSMLPRETAAEFAQQRVDFSLEAGPLRWMVEVDGLQHHDNASQRALDKARDKSLADAGWSITRIPTSARDANSTVTTLREKLQGSSWRQRVEANYHQPLWRNHMQLAAMHVVLTPYAVARLQRALLVALEMGALTLEQPTWSLVVIERDIHCAELAVLDFVEHLQNIAQLAGIEVTLPQIELLVYHTPEFVDVQFDLKAEMSREGIQTRQQPLSQATHATASADLVLDVAMLQPSGFDRLDSETSDRHLAPYGVVYELRNCLYSQDLRQLHSCPLRAYPSTPETDQALHFFLQNIFRKQTFRDGQLKILRRALGYQPVIGLLPTGGGKSLCYQLAALLQPGMTLVIDPLVSLMMDQVDNLRSNFAIDWTLYINSLQSTKEREAATDQMATGRAMFVFISPERLQIQAFRNRLEEFSSMIAVAFAVIDEAHCVSEWGHDFRTAYLRLARTIQRYCLHRGKSPALIALTGTASFAVLSDVQREIGIEDEDAQVYPESFDRRELQFGVMQCPSDDKLKPLLELIAVRLPEALHRTKESLLLPNGEETAAGIVFTPHVKGDFGAHSVRNKLAHRFPQADVQCFTGSDDGSTKTEVQNAFKRNEFALLVATKAFGMGIDKPNVRFTVHYNIPASLESFYQEAGRAGRDQQPAYCWMIYSDDDPADADSQLLAAASPTQQTYGTQQKSKRSSHDVDRLLWFHGNAFRGIEPELEEIEQLYKKFIYPELIATQAERVKVVIPFGVSIEKYDNSQTNRDKALYRLSILGLVEDYTLDYNARQFVVHVVRCADNDYVSNLQRYIKRYKTREAVDQVPTAVAREAGATMLGRCAAYLLHFVYEEIAAKRRAAIRTMVEMARKAAAMREAAACSEFVRGELLAYLEKSPFTEPLVELAKRTDFAEWKAVLELKDTHGQALINSVDGLRQLLGGCRRTLESNLDHPGLLFLSSLARLLMPDPDVTIALQEAQRAFSGLAILEPQRQQQIVRAILQEYRNRLRDTEDGAAQQQTLAECALSVLPTRWLARDLIEETPMRSRELLMSFILADVEALSARLVA